MAICKFCGTAFSWGNNGGKWVPLVPVGEEAGLTLDYQDEDGVLRASHRQTCVQIGGPTVHVSKLAKPLQAGDVMFPPMPKEKKFTLKRKKGGK